MLSAAWAGWQEVVWYIHEHGQPPMRKKFMPWFKRYLKYGDYGLHKGPRQ